ncbi:MAG: hypothetical protein ACYTF6_14625 [Planctomycetota bacterium]|jgi:hypothetical protein
MMMRKLFLFLALALLLTGCTDPVKLEKARAIRVEAEANAHAVRSEADVEAMATVTAVAIEAQAANVSISATATRIADEEAVMAKTQKDRVARQENLIWWSSIAGVVVILALGLAIGISSVGTATAFTYWAKQQARLIWMDKTTRTWPVMLDVKTGVLVDLETGERARLVSAQRVDHRRLVISGQVRTTGLLVQAAENIAKDAKDAKPGDMLPAIGQSVPLLKEAEETGALKIPDT